MIPLHDDHDGHATTSNNLQIHGHSNSNHLSTVSSSSTTASDVQILYMPIATPPTPAPSPPPAILTLHSNSQLNYDLGQVSTPLHIPSFETNNPALRREYLTSIIRSCTPEELLFLSHTIGGLLKPKAFEFNLPEELIFLIFLSIDDFRTLVNASQVSRMWNRIAKDESIWREMVIAYELEGMEEAEEEWKQYRRKVLERKIRAKQKWSMLASETEGGSAPLQDEGDISPLSTPPNDSEPLPFRLSYRRFFRDTCIINDNWRHGGKLLHQHRLPIISPDSGTVTSLALDKRWVVIGLANSMIKVYEARTGLLVRTLLGHESGVWGVCLVSQGGSRLLEKPATDAPRFYGRDCGAPSQEVQDNGPRAEGSRTGKRKRKKGAEGAMFQDIGEGGVEDVNRESKDALNGTKGESKKNTKGKGKEEEDNHDDLPARVAALNVYPNRDGSHVMPDTLLQPLISPEMQRALDLEVTTDGSGSSSGTSSGPEDKTGRARRYVDAGEQEDPAETIPGTDMPEMPFNMTYSSHGWGQPNSIIVSGGCDKVVRVWDLRSGQCIYVLHGHLSTIRSLRVLNRRPIAVTGSRDATLRVWDVQKGRCLRVLEGHSASVRCLDVFGDKVVSGSYDHTCRLWNIDTGECLHVLTGHFSQIYSVAFDGVRIASGGLDTTVRIWDVETGRCIALLQGHTALVCQLQLSPTMLATGGSDGRVITFSLQTYKALHRIAAHDSSVTSLQFNKDFLLTGGNDGRVRVYETATGAFVREFSEPSESVWKAGFVRGTCAIMCKRADKTVVEIWSMNPKRKDRKKTQ
ncbi:WD40 repeat-like protein [Pholiota conissans]|uniref:WD40 repeat-like protein n=1 Tax=Pholiota conissans TaxID=109636 RepID=A0A9P6D430_9AGAR|nr:WD40 repeat-like protein [Pholiota conissans]